jgi:hypothetical protein
VENRFSCGKGVPVGVPGRGYAYILFTNGSFLPLVYPVVNGGKIRVFNITVENGVERV